MDPVAALASTGGKPAESKDAFSALSSEQFVKIMFAELQRQDPLKPNDSSEMLKQLSEIRAIQSDLDLQKNLTALVSQNQLATAGGLIGQRIIGQTENFERVVGKVESVIRTSDGPVLRLTTGKIVPFGSLEQILDTPPATPTTPTTPTTPPTPAPTAPTPTTPVDPPVAPPVAPPPAGTRPTANPTAPTNPTGSGQP